MSKTAESSLRFDLAIALFALFVSIVAAGASMYQSAVLARQLSATVWPYLNTDKTLTNSGARARLEFDVRNNGTGPAIIRGASVSVDGIRQPSLSAAVRKLVSDTHALLAHASSLGPGNVITANQSVTFLTLDLNSAGAQKASERLKFSVCYCSLLGECWYTDNRIDEPRREKDCSALKGVRINAG